MTINSKALPLFIYVVTIVCLFACDPGNANSKENKTQVVKESIPLQLDTFATFPPEIDGCSCYFSNDSNEFKNKVYIYMNDYAETSFLKINGVLTKFTQTSFKKSDSTKTIAEAKSKDYELTIEVINGNQTGEETIQQTGTITVKHKKGKFTTKKFYGECGC